MSAEMLKGLGREHIERVKAYARTKIATAHEVMDRAATAKELRAQQGVVHAMQTLIRDLEHSVKPIEPTAPHAHSDPAPIGVPPGLAIGR